MRRIAIIPGDGIGPEVMAEAVKVLTAIRERSGLDLQLDRFDFGAEKFLQTGVTIPDDQIEVFRQHYDAIFMGPLGDPRVPQSSYVREIYQQLYHKLDLFVYFRPVRLWHERYCPLKGKKPEDLNLALLAEHSEGIRIGLGGVFHKGTDDEVALRQYLHTRRGVDRLLRYAFEYTRLHGLKRLTLSCRSDPFMSEDDLWERLFTQMAKEFSEIEASCMSVSHLLRQLLKAPETFEVVVSCNLYGELISDLCAQLQGGAGLAAAAKLNPGKISIFAPAHSSAPKQAGQHVANPLAAISSAALMLDHLGFEQEARWANSAVKYALDTNNTTRDLGGRLGTHQVGDFIANQIQKGIC